MAGGPPFAWEPENGVHIGLLPRRGGSAGDIRWLSMDTCFTFHFIFFSAPNSIGASESLIPDPFGPRNLAQSAWATELAMMSIPNSAAIYVDGFPRNMMDLGE